jgi:hypothetical protein
VPENRGTVLLPAVGNRKHQVAIHKNNSIEHSPFGESKSLADIQEIPHNLWRPNSLPNSKQPAVISYPEPDKLTPHHLMLFL